MTEFDDDGIDLPDDDLGGEPDLMDLDSADETLDLDLEVSEGLAESGGDAHVFAPAAPARSITPRTAAARRVSASARSGGKKKAAGKTAKKAAKKVARKAAKKAAPVKKSAPAKKTAGARKKPGGAANGARKRGSVAKKAVKKKAAKKAVKKVAKKAAKKKR